MSNIELLDQFSKIKVLADPRRLKIIQLLMAKSASLTQLGQMLGQHPARIRHHIQKLEEAGLIELNEITITRGVTEKFYKAKAGAYLLQKMILPEDIGGRYGKMVQPVLSVKRPCQMTHEMFRFRH